MMFTFSAFEAIVPPLLEAFKPDIVFAQIGGDLHREDPSRIST